MTGEWTDGLAQVRAGVDVLLAGSLDHLSGPDIADLLDALEVQRRRLDAVDSRIVAAADERGIAGEFGRPTTADLLAVRLRLDGREATQRVERARRLGPRRALTGEPLPPLLPTTADAQATGRISGAHATVVAATLSALDHLPTAADLAGPVEEFLVDAAAHESPRALARTAALLRARLDPDGIEPREVRLARRRGLSIVPTPDDGGAVISGRLTAECAAVWQVIIDALSAPLTGSDVTNGGLGSVPHDVRDVRDDRTPTQRRHDGFEEAGLRILRSGTLPDSGGVPVTLLVTTTEPELQLPQGRGRTSRGDVLALGPLLRGGEIEINAVRVGASGEVLSLGRTRRLAQPAQRRALTARDGGCCFPGCTRPAAWTQAHHVVAWVDGGPTDIDNLCLVCPFHHRLLDRGEWQVRMRDGRPEWIPPPWVDIERRPQRNHVHHPQEIVFPTETLAAQPCRR